MLKDEVSPQILKDFINRYQILQGRKVTYVPGWDCHGLPIELKVLQSMDQEARNFALKTIDKQRDSFKRYGIWGEWEVCELGWLASDTVPLTLLADAGPVHDFATRV